MSEGDQINVRASRAFKKNTRDLVETLWRLGLRENRSVSAYVIEAVKEKRERDAAMVESMNSSQSASS